MRPRALVGDTSPRPGAGVSDDANRIGICEWRLRESTS